jgi:hypothetical protein
LIQTAGAALPRCAATLSTQCHSLPLWDSRRRALGGDGRLFDPFNSPIDGKLMKKLIAVTVAGLFALAGAYADETKKDEKKTDAKPSTEMKKEATKADTKKTDTTKADTKKADATKTDAKKADAKKADTKKADAKKDEPKKDEAKKDEAKK